MSDSFSQDLVLSPLQLGYGEKYLMFTLQVTMTATTLLSQVTKHLRFVSIFVNFITIKLDQVTSRDLLQVIVTLSLLVS